MVLISFHADQIFHGWFCSLLVHSHVDLLLVAHSYVCFCQIFNRGVTELDCSITFTELAVAQNNSAITVITTLWNCNGGDAIFLTFDYKAMVTVMPLFLSFDLRWTLFQHEASWWFPPDCESPVRVELSFWDSDSKYLAQNWIKNSPFSSFCLDICKSYQVLLFYELLQRSILLPDNDDDHHDNNDDDYYTIIINNAFPASQLLWFIDQFAVW